MPIYKRVLSYLYPVTVTKISSDKHSWLELCLYRGQYQLATRDALYSDGERYKPLILAFKHLKKELKLVKSVLLLGTGLGSAVHILHGKGYDPIYTLVEYDKSILDCAIELFPVNVKGKIKKVHADALQYMEQCADHYDLVVADLFIGRVVSEFVTSEEFLQNCKKALNPGGCFVLNYIINTNAEWQKAEIQLKNNFPAGATIENGINRIYIAKV